MTIISRADRFNRLCASLSMAALASCGGSDDGGSAPRTPVATTVAVVPAASMVSTARALGIAVDVTGAAPASGTVTLTAGAFSSGAVTLAAGAATIVVPSGVLPVGPDTLTVAYSPSTGSASVTVVGTAVVVVTAAPMPVVTTQSVNVATNGHPFEALPVGADLIVSVTSNGNPGSVTGIRAYTAGALSTPLPTAPTYRCTQVASHPDAAGNADALGLAVAPNGRGIALAIDDAGVDLLNGPLTAGCASAESVVQQGDPSTAPGTFAVAITPDGRYAFVANEYGIVATDSAGAGIDGNVGVVSLQYDAAGNLSGGMLVGRFSTGGQAIANVTVSPDGSRLYVTSEIVHPGVAIAGLGNATLAHGGCLQSSTDAAGNVTTTTSTYGLLTIVDVAKAEANPTTAAIIATTASGCSPVRVVETADQQVIWVAVRGDNRVLAFGAHALETDPDAALLGYGDTGGQAPVGLQLFHGGQLLAVANSNRFSSPAVIGNMTILSATPVAPTVVQTVAAYYFPRSISEAADDATLYLTDYDYSTVQVISTVVK